MSINKINIGKKARKKGFIFSTITIIVSGIIVSIILILHFSFGGNNRLSNFKQARDLYKNIFVKKDRNYNKNIFSNNTLLIANDIYKTYDKSDSDNIPPIYTLNTRETYITKEQKNIYQFEDFDFTHGSGEFGDWGRVVILIFKNNKLIDMQWKR